MPLPSRLQFAALGLIATIAGATAGACRQVEGTFPSATGRYPNVKFLRNGTLTIVTRSTGGGDASDVCSAATRIDEQNDADGTFSGTLTTSGGSGNCDQTGSLTGRTERYTSDSNYKPPVSIVPSGPVLPPLACTRTDGDGVFRGQMGGNNVVTFTATDSYACSNPAQAISRTLTLSVGP